MPALALLAAPATVALDALRERVKASARRRPGVYQFLDADGGVFYVGKAKDLRARLLSYFSAPWPDSKAAHLVRAAADITWRYQPSEFAALLEELRLIARLRPFSNVRGNRTRRRMVFVKLTGGVAPKLKVTEHTTDRAARYYGPFQSHWRTADAVRVLADLLRLRDCAQDRPLRYAGQEDLFGAAEIPAACLRHELGTCLGPCAAKCTAEAYGGAVAHAAAFLESRAVAPLDRVVDAMAEASDARDFERAAGWREKLEALESLFAAVSRLRAATEALTFVYGVRDRTPAARGGGHDDRVYLVHRGLVRALAPWPRTPIERSAFAGAVERWAGQDAGGPAARTAPEMDELLLVMSWFRQHPEEFESTTPLAAWLAAEGPAAS
ncbi:MAG TPA: UvrB/UvrC motif-containing protein [Gemmatimonadales bacterium]|nr:UvrB/UvrC motif-containing protein [Gemmatimonadales bacterium]